MGPKVSLLLLTQNRYVMTSYVLEKMLDGISDYELLILDNGSTDKKTRELGKSLATTHIQKEENIGIAAGFNELLRIAKGEYICFLSNDILVGEGWLKNLIEFNDEIDRSGLTTIHCEYEKGVYGPLLNVSDTFTSVWIPNNNITSGVSLINRATFNKIGGFDQRLGIYGKEREQYAQRLNLLGHYNYYIPGQYSIHLGRDINEVSDYKKMKDVETQKALIAYPSTIIEMKKNVNFKIEL